MEKGTKVTMNICGQQYEGVVVSEKPFNIGNYLLVHIIWTDATQSYEQIKDLNEPIGSGKN